MNKRIITIIIELHVKSDRIVRTAAETVVFGMVLPGVDNFLHRHINPFFISLHRPRCAFSPAKIQIFPYTTKYISILFTARWFLARNQVRLVANRSQRLDFRVRQKNLQLKRVTELMKQEVCHSSPSPSCRVSFLIGIVSPALHHCCQPPWHQQRCYLQGSFR